jgi:hypothetical protein
MTTDALLPASAIEEAAWDCLAAPESMEPVKAIATSPIATIAPKAVFAVSQWSLPVSLPALRPYSWLSVTVPLRSNVQLRSYFALNWIRHEPFNRA